MERRIENSTFKDRIRRGYVRDPKFLSYCTSGLRPGQTFTVVTAKGGEVSFRKMEERNGSPIGKQRIYYDDDE